MRFTRIAVAALAAFPAACASVVEGDTQLINVSTTPVPGANCTLSNKRGSWTLVTPAAVIVKKSQSTLKAVCTKDGWNDATTYLASTESSGAIVGALAIGFPEAIVDASTGAGNNYPKDFTIHMKPKAVNDAPPAAAATSAVSSMPKPIITHN